MYPASRPPLFLAHEARALLTRLDRLEPFSVTMPTVAGAAISRSALVAIERHLLHERRHLRSRVSSFLRWIGEGGAHETAPEEQQRRFTVLRLQFNAELDQLDIFADVLTQRSEHETGIWLAGLDVVARDALRLREPFFEPPPLVTYLDRGHGAAIRRARTRLPGGSTNPVAIVRVPRERMVGSGIGASLIHEVGHQGSALLQLPESLRRVLQAQARRGGAEAPAWTLWDRWISEILSDFWAVARIGVSATVGLIGTVSLPRAFVFRVQLDDPHPFPWIRAKLSCALGQALYPDPQWSRLDHLWEAFYPRTDLTAPKRQLISLLERTMPAFVRLLIHHRPPTLNGHSLGEVMPVAERQPAELRSCFWAWGSAPSRMCTASPTLVMAVLGQARADGRLTPERESRRLEQLLKHWALSQALSAEDRLPECSRTLAIPAGAA